MPKAIRVRAGWSEEAIGPSFSLKVERRARKGFDAEGFESQAGGITRSMTDELLVLGHLIRNRTALSSRPSAPHPTRPAPPSSEGEKETKADLYRFYLTRAPKPQTAHRLAD